VIPWEFLSGFVQGCDSKGVKYKSGKSGFGSGIGKADGIRSGEGSAKSGCIRRMRSFSNSHIYLFYRASKEGLVEKGGADACGRDCGAKNVVEDIRRNAVYVYGFDLAFSSMER
jgi:hypothetical protein